MNIHLIYDAIQAVENAIEIYDHEFISSSIKMPNTYGRALSYFQLGYLYETFADELVMSKDNNKKDFRGNSASPRALSKLRSV